MAGTGDIKARVQRALDQGLGWLKDRAAALGGSGEAEGDSKAGLIQGPPPLRPEEQQRLMEAWQTLLDRQPNDYVTVHDESLLPASKGRMLAMLQGVWRENRSAERVQLFVLSSAAYLAQFQEGIGPSRPLDAALQSQIEAEAERYRRLLEEGT